MAEGESAPLLSKSNIDKDLVYVLLFKHPFDEKNHDWLKKKRTVKKAVKQFLRIFKTTPTDTAKCAKILHRFKHQISWLSKFETEPKLEITNEEFLTSTISAILYDLENVVGLRYSLFSSRDKDEIFCKLYATEGWLKAKAKEISYNLQLRDLATPEEIEKDPFKKYPPYADYEVDQDEYAAEIETVFKHFDYMDNEVKPGENGSLFMYNDKVRIVKNILLTHFDFNQMADYEVLNEDFCVHNQEILAGLKQDWARVGALFKAQPLNRIRNYFGEKVSLYFAWMRCYNIFMVFAAIFGLALFILQYTLEDDQKTLLQIFTVAFSIYLSFWAAFFDQIWVRSEKTYAWQWGTIGFEQEEDQRGEFKGEFGRDEVTGLMKKHREKSDYYKIRQLFSYSVACVFVVCVIAAVIGIFIFRAANKTQSWSPQVCGLLNAIQIRVMNIIYGKVAQFLNDWENHETETQFNDNLAVKLFLFKFVNSYISLFYIAFIKNYFDDCNPDCMSELSTQLAFIFIVNLSLNVVELGLPWFKHKLSVWKENRKVKKMKLADDSIREYMGPIEAQAKFEDYESPLDDYMEMAVQFGYVALFCSAFPILPLLALIEITLEIRVDAWKLCCLTKRPFPHRAEDIGVWRAILVTIAYAGSISNAALVVFTSGIFDDYNNDEYKLLLIFIGLEHILLFSKFVIGVIIPDVPADVEDGEIWGKRMVKEIMYLQTESSHGRRAQDNTASDQVTNQDIILKTSMIKYYED